MFYYIEIDDNGIILSFGETTNIDSALVKTENIILQLTQQEYMIINGCKGNIGRGKYLLDNVQNKINEYFKNNQ